MENRFGIRDLLIVVLLILVLASLWLAMKQYDRQWDVIRSMNEKIDQQTRDVSEVRRMLNKAGTAAVTPPTHNAAAVTEGQDPFARINAARAMPDFAEGDWCIDAFGANVAKITPLVTVDAYGSTIQNTVLESLATRDPDTLEWKPLLAESWTIQDNMKPWQAYVDARLAKPLTAQEVEQEKDCPPAGETQKRSEYIEARLKEGRRIADIAREKGCPAATVITFKLRRGVVYSDGLPLSATDFAFTFRFINNPKVDAPRDRQGLDNVRSVEAEGDDTVVFTFNEPYFESFGLAAGMQPLAKHFYGRYMDAPEEFNKSTGLLLGTGPYRMESPTDWSPGKLLALVRNQRYWGVPPAFDRIIYREINNDAARLTMFRNREIDLFGAMPEQYVEVKKDAAFMARVTAHEFERVTGGYGFIAWNQKRGGQATFFADARVRRAMTMMIDRQRLFDDLLLGFGIPVTGPFNRLSPQYDQAITPLPFDIAAARTLLKEAGYFDRNNDGIIDTPDGQPFRFKLLFPSQTGFWDRVALLLKDNYAKAGVVLELEPLEWSVFAERVKSRDYDALCMAWTGGIESDIRQMFHSSQIAQGADNFMSYTNTKLDKLIDTARRTVVEEKRMPLWQECHRILHEDQPYTFLYSRKSLLFIDGRVQNVQRVKVGLNDRFEWYVPRAMQLRKD